MHDVDSQRWALNAQRQVGLHGFVASSHWLLNFKNIHGIVSRKITKFVTKHGIHQQEEQTSQSALFVEDVKTQLTVHGPENIYNSDQSEFNLELHSGRTLARRGCKKIETVVQSVASTTHSYTIQPTISASGKLHSPLLLILKEVTEEFGP